MKTNRLLLVTSIMLLVCACGSSARQRALNASLAGLNAARDGFVIYDEREQGRIVDACHPLADGEVAQPGGCYTVEEGEKRLKDYRVKRDHVVAAFVVAYGALAAAASDQTAQKIAEAASAAAALYALIKDFMSAPAVAEPAVAAPAVAAPATDAVPVPPPATTTPPDPK